MNLTFLTVIMITQNHQLTKKMKRMVMTTVMVIHSNILILEIIIQLTL